MTQRIAEDEKSQIINYIATHIKINEENLVDSVYRLKNSLFDITKDKNFSINHLIPLIENTENSAVVDYLVNVMHEKKYLNGSFFYLSQLCIMTTYKTYTESLVEYILDKCYSYLKFSVYFILLFHSFPQTQLIQKISFYIEESLRKNIKVSTKNEFSVSQSILCRESKGNYYYRNLEFYDNLNKICLILFDYPAKQENNKLSRDQVLMEFVTLINNEIESIRKENYSRIKDSQEKGNISKNEDLEYNKGYILPFSTLEPGKEEKTTIIVNLVPEYSKCFSTKERVPVKICCECIDMAECENFFDIYDDPEFFAQSFEESINASIHDSISKHISNKKKKAKEKIIDKWRNLEKLITISKNELEDSTKKEEPKGENMFVSEIVMNDFVDIHYDMEKINPFGKPKEIVFEEMKKNSKFRNFKSYEVINFIAKANDDLMQEMLTVKLIKIFEDTFAKIGIYVKSYEILITSPTSGLIEFLDNTCSIDGIIKRLPKNWTLNTFFRNFFSKDFQRAQKEFASSLAGFCLLSYYLQIKDRHNGNILLDNQGHIMHIDFGFILGSSPKNLGFEKAQFKLKKEYIDILDGFNSPMYKYFKKKLIEGLIECKKSYEILSTIIRVMSKINLKCFASQNYEEVIKVFQSKFLFNMKSEDIEKYVDKLIQESYNNFWTEKYDYFQYLTNGIAY